MATVKGTIVIVDSLVTVAPLWPTLDTERVVDQALCFLVEKYHTYHASHQLIDTAAKVSFGTYLCSTHDGFEVWS